MQSRETELADLLRAALAGDASAYRRFLDRLARSLRPAVRAASQRAGLPAADHEDVLQEVLLAIHAKRHTWQTGEPLGPWMHAIVRYKVIDAFRRRGRRVEIPIEDVMNELPEPAVEAEPSATDILDRYMGVLTARQYEIVKAVSIDHAGIRQTATRFAMTEGAVRVALHRAIAALSRAYRKSVT